MALSIYVDRVLRADPDTAANQNRQRADRGADPNPEVGRQKVTTNRCEAVERRLGRLGHRQRLENPF